MASAYQVLIERRLERRFSLRHTLHEQLLAVRPQLSSRVLTPELPEPVDHERVQRALAILSRNVGNGGHL